MAAATMRPRASAPLMSHSSRTHRGGTLILGAEERDHVLHRVLGVSEPNGLVHWIDDVVNGQLEPVPPIEPVVLTHPDTGVAVVVLNVPPVPALVARKTNES